VCVCACRELQAATFFSCQKSPLLAFTWDERKPRTARKRSDLRFVRSLVSVGWADQQRQYWTTECNLSYLISYLSIYLSIYLSVCVISGMLRPWLLFSGMSSSKRTNN
jgi:hypothetical protein